MTEQTRNEWTQPQLRVLGDIEDLTLAGKEKSFGGHDGFLFENQSISG